MTLNRAEIRTKIREILREFYDTDTVATGGIDGSSATLPVNNVSRYKVNDVLLIESEMMKIESVDAGGNLTVTRGAFESTAAAHVATTTIKIIAEFTDRMLNQAIDFAIGDTFNTDGTGMWIETIDETLTTALTAATSGREYTIPSGLTFIARIQVENDDGTFIENRDWELIGTVIQFKKNFNDAGKTIRLIGQSYQALLTDDNTALTLGIEQAQFIIYDAAFYALQQRFAHRLKATEYSASVNDRAGQPIELVNMVNTIRRTVNDLRRREFKPRMAEYATRPRR